MNNQDDVQESINKAFEMSLLNVNADVLKDLGEIGLDMLLEDGSLLEQIPILKLGVALCKTTISIRDRILFSNVLNFITEFNNGAISHNDLEKHQKSIEDEKILKQEYEYVIRYIDLCTDKFHASMLAKIYRSYVLGTIDWAQFCELSEANRRLFVSDCSLLKRIECLKKISTVSENEESGVNRLYSLGLIIDKRTHRHYGFEYVFTNGETYSDLDDEENVVELTKLGTLFCKYIHIN